MTTRAADRDDVAAEHLSRLADEVRKLGLDAELEKDHRPFPGLVVTVPGASVTILAGSAHFWRHAREGDIKRVAPLEEPGKAARAVHKRLMERKTPRHSR